MNAASSSLTRPYIVAIDGKSGVGKSSFSQQLAGAGTNIISGDDFYAGGRSAREDPLQSRVDQCIDWRLQSSVLSDLRRGDAAAWRAYDWNSFDGSREARVTTCEPNRVLVLEGVYSTRPELAEQLDLTVLLQAPEEKRRRRLLRREGRLTLWERRWHEAEDYYFAQLKPPSAFDLVLNSNE